jgi:hypothetical protein
VFFRLPHITANRAEAELQSVYRTGTKEELSTQGTQSADYLRELSHEQVRLVPAS